MNCQIGDIQICEYCWIRKSRGVIQRHPLRIFFLWCNKYHNEIPTGCLSKAWEACFPSFLNSTFLSKASAITSLPKESYFLPPLLAVRWHPMRSPRLHPLLPVRLPCCHLHGCWHNCYLSCLAQGLFSRLAACFLVLKVNSLSCMPRRKRKEVTKESKNWLEII